MKMVMKKINKKILCIIAMLLIFVGSAFAGGRTCRVIVHNKLHKGVMVTVDGTRLFCASGKVELLPKQLEPGTYEIKLLYENDKGEEEIDQETLTVTKEMVKKCRQRHELTGDIVLIEVIK